MLTMEEFEQTDTYKDWVAEIDGIEKGIRRFYKQNPDIKDKAYSLFQRSIQSDDIEESVTLMHDASQFIWESMDAENWLGGNYYCSDVWDIAFSGSFA